MAPVAAEADLLGPLCKALRLYLSLGRDGVLCLVHGATRGGLRGVVVRLLPTEPELDVLTEVEELDALPAGAAAVLCLRAERLSEDARWLNLRRSQFADRRLRIVLWGEDDLGERLALLAPDFADWISHRLFFPPALRGAPEAHLVSGLRAMLLRRLPAAVMPGWSAWGGDLERLVAEALPRWQPVRHRVGAYDDLCAVLARPGRVLPCLVVTTEFALQRVRFALHDTRRRRPVLLLDTLRAPRSLPLRGGLVPVHEARELLSGIARRPGRLAVLLGLEEAAIRLAVTLGPEVAALEPELVDAADPGGLLAGFASARGVKVSTALALRSGEVPKAPRQLALKPTPRRALSTGDVPLAQRLGHNKINPLAQARAAMQSMPYYYLLNLTLMPPLLDGEPGVAESELRKWLAKTQPILWDVDPAVRAMRRACRRAQGYSVKTPPVSERWPGPWWVLCSAVDRALAEELVAWLSALDTVPEIRWDPRPDAPGSVLALLSADLLADDDKAAVLRATAATCLPILLRACDWEAEFPELRRHLIPEPEVGDLASEQEPGPALSSVLRALMAN